MNTKLLFGGALLAVVSTAAPSAFAVGAGVPFVFREAFVPANNVNVPGNSLDLTYHSCVDFTAANTFTETGYFWISSFQDVDSVVDSQINYVVAANGYHLYARYQFQGEDCQDPQGTCNGGTRRNYRIDQAALTLYKDPNADTTIALDANCQLVFNNIGDDRPLGTANAIQSGQKTETDDLANGDFDVVFANWVFTAFGMDLFRTPNNMPLAVPTLVFDANVTRLQGPLNDDHRPEGSGNIFWRD